MDEKHEIQENAIFIADSISKHSADERSKRTTRYVDNIVTFTVGTNKSIHTTRNFTV